MHRYIFLLTFKVFNMKKNLMILAHPNLGNSIANKIIAEEIGRLENVEVRDIATLYPDFNIDAKAEQEALLNADRIIFQYPIYWYNMPPVLKQWFDQVLTYGFAYGEETYNLEGKEMMASVTTGGPAEGYAGDILESKILFNMEGTAGFCKMKYLKPIVLHGMMAMPGKDTAPLISSAKEHTKKVIEILNKLIINKK